MLPNFLKITKNHKNQNVSLNTNSSEFEIDKWVISQFIVEKILPITGYTPYPIDELILMIGSVCRFQPTHIFEWGTHVGKSARIFYETINHFNIDAEIHSFDLPDEIYHQEHPHEKRGMLVKGLNKVNLYQEDGLVKSFQIFDNSIIKNKKALFYVDGDHSYETVYKELETILNTLPHVAILLHDTFFQSEESGYNIGPYKAINDVLQKCSLKYQKVTTTMGLPGMTLIVL
jgi:hypothetical protein